MCALSHEVGGLGCLVVELCELLGLWFQLRVGIPEGLGDLIGFTLSCFHDLTASVNRVGGALDSLRDTLNHRDGILWVHRTGLCRGCQRGTGLCGRAEALRGLPGRLPDLLTGLHVGLHIARKALHRLRCILSQCLGIRTLLVVLLTASRGGRAHQQCGQVIVTRLIVAILLTAILLIVLRREPRRLLLFLILLVLLQLFGQIIDALAILRALLLLILQLAG
ncbi:Uncharacterised protein [Mycobacteroides abscessus]|nr:Uncharacterised protein [Mycobacteroides abscessus]CPZ19853.1 Uncharacterised protein [Mycobacteroides abscessus]